MLWSFYLDRSSLLPFWGVCGAGRFWACPRMLLWVFLLSLGDAFADVVKSIKLLNDFPSWAMLLVLRSGNSCLYFVKSSNDLLSWMMWLVPGSCDAFAYERGRLVLDGLFCVLALVLLDKPFFHILRASLYHTARTFRHWAVLWHFISPVLRLSLWFLTAFRLILLAFHTFFGFWLAKLGRFERVWYLWCKLAWDSVHIFNRVFLLWGLYFALL